ncbi:MAG: hypothetical protein HYX78_09875 [Armatimonadetes bacterium]|nr:hypothetical protein [Armatimonadota bacterium]
MPKGFEDLGVVLDVSALAASQTAWSEWIDGLTWVSYLILGVITTGSCNVVYQTRDSGGRLHESSTVGTSVEQLDPEWVRLAVLSNPGWSFRVGVYNNSGAPQNYKIAAQVLG